jgi:hypothetical protein
MLSSLWRRSIGATSLHKTSSIIGARPSLVIGSNNTQLRSNTSSSPDLLHNALHRSQDLAHYRPFNTIQERHSFAEASPKLFDNSGCGSWSCCPG